MSGYEHGPGMLRISKDLGWALESELREQCRQLLEGGTPTLTVDLSAVHHVCSANMVAFAHLGAIAQKAGKRLTLLVNSRVARSFEMAGFGEFADLHAQD